MKDADDLARAAARCDSRCAARRDCDARQRARDARADVERRLMCAQHGDARLDALRGDDAVDVVADLGVRVA